MTGQPRASPDPGVSGVVLAGGRSSRFASTGSKLDADLGGRSVLDRTIDAVRSICGTVIVAGRSAGPRHEVRYVADARAFDGPLAGLLVGLAAATDGVVLIVGGDMPLLPPAVLRLLVDRLVASPTTDATVLYDGVAPRPLPAAVRRETALSAARELAGANRTALRDLLAVLNVETLAPSAWRPVDPDGNWQLDIDRPNDLEAARRRLGA